MSQSCDDSQVDQIKRRTLRDAYDEMIKRSRRLSDGFVPSIEPSKECTLESFLPSPRKYNMKPWEFSDGDTEAGGTSNVNCRSGLLKRPEAISSVVSCVKVNADGRPTDVDGCS